MDQLGTDAPSLPNSDSANGLNQQAGGFSFDEPVFTPIIPNILIVEPSTPDHSGSPTKSLEEEFIGRMTLDDNKEEETNKRNGEAKGDGEIAEDLTVSSSPLNDRHSIRTLVETPTNVDSEPTMAETVLGRIMANKDTLTAPRPVELPPSPTLLLPPDELSNIREFTTDRLQVAQFNPELANVANLQASEDSISISGMRNRRDFLANCCTIV